MKFFRARQRYGRPKYSLVMRNKHHWCFSTDCLYQIWGSLNFPAEAPFRPFIIFCSPLNDKNINDNQRKRKKPPNQKTSTSRTIIFSLDNAFCNRKTNSWFLLRKRCLFQLLCFSNGMEVMRMTLKRLLLELLSQHLELLLITTRSGTLQQMLSCSQHIVFIIETDRNDKINPKWLLKNRTVATALYFVHVAPTQIISKSMIRWTSKVRNLRKHVRSGCCLILSTVDRSPKDEAEN